MWNGRAAGAALRQLFAVPAVHNNVSPHTVVRTFMSELNGRPEVEWPYNTNPADYAFDLVNKIPRSKDHSISPSNCVLAALKKACPATRTKFFRQSVLDAIFDDCLANDWEDEKYCARLVERLERRFGKRKARSILVDRVDVLHTWRFRDALMIPDASLIDAENKTVVCYEIEDTHPLNPRSINEYAAAWWNLEYVFWDLHLIAYDIYGHSRTVVFPEASFIADHILHRRTAHCDDAG